MAITTFQRDVLRLIAKARMARGESYVAGGVALNLLLKGRRFSRDIDIFHDTEEALATSWSEDRKALLASGYTVIPVREAPTFVEARVARAGEVMLMQWTRDSAFRFFPLISDDLMGLVLHPFDLATNKVLAMVGRLEPRDWVDLILCHERLQPLGLLIWAACGKDPGYNPRSLLAEAARAHYSQVELESLDFGKQSPDAGALGQTWHKAMAQATTVLGGLPPSEVGRCVLDASGALLRGTAEQIIDVVKSRTCFFHPGQIGGAWPTIVEQRRPAT